MSGTKSAQTSSDEPIECIFDPDFVDWCKSRIALALKLLHCFDDDEWFDELSTLDKIEDPKEIVLTLLSHLALPDSVRVDLINAPPSRSLNFLCGVFEQTVYAKILEWRISTLFPELTAASKPLLALNRAGVPIDAPDLQDALAHKELREKLLSAARDPKIREAVNDWTSIYCRKAIDYVSPMIVERVDSFMATLFTEAGAHEAKKALDRGGHSDVMLREFLKEARKQHIKVVKDDVTVRMGIRRGATKGAKKSKVKIGKRELETLMHQLIRQFTQSNIEPTRDRVAKGIGLSNAKALDRLRGVYHDKRVWRDVVTEAECTK